MTYRNTILVGDVREQLALLPDECVHSVVTSPPYWGLRDYGTAEWEGGDAECSHSYGRFERGGLSRKQASNNGSNGDEARRECACGARRIDKGLGLEPTPEEYVANMVSVFREVRRVLRRDGTLWLNLGDSYAANRTYQVTDNKHIDVGNNGGMSVPPGLKPKDLVGIPWRVAFALQQDGWYLRSDIIWSKPNPMPESVTDRPTKAHEYVFLLTRSEHYYYDAEAIREPVMHPELLDAKRSVGFIGNAERFERPTGLQGGHYANPAGRNKRTVWEIATQPFSDWTESVRWVPVGEGDSFDGTKRITSQDCPEHVGLPDSEPNGAYGGRAAGSQSRTERTADYPVPKPAVDFVPTGLPLFEDLQADNLDLPIPSRSRAATDHSSGMSRMDLVPVTSPSYTASGETAAGIGGTSASHELLGPGGSDNRETLGTLGYKSHSACTCSYLKPVTESISHFATYPEALVLSCILAGTSEWGCCSECGAPWKRVVERAYGQDSSSTHHIAGGDRTIGQGWEGYQRRAEVETRTTGWQPTCSHNAPTQPAITLDPFLGSGTTALVALKAGRDFIGIELNPAYVEMAEKRIAPYRWRLL